MPDRAHQKPESFVKLLVQLLAERYAGGPLGGQ
jgi:hypothetical protein